MGYSRELLPSTGSWHVPQQPAVLDSEWYGWGILGLFAQAPLVLAQSFCFRLHNCLTTASEKAHWTHCRPLDRAQLVAKRTVCLLALLFLSVVTGAQTTAANNAMSHEEAVVRATYAKLSCATEIGYSWHQIAQRAKSAGSETLPAGGPPELRFQLSDFTVGDVQFLGAVPWTSAISGPVKIIKAEYRELPSREFNSKKHVAGFFYADIAWASGVHEVVSDLVEGSKIVNFPEYVKALQQPKNGMEWTRFATYSVMAILDDHQISYRATFLFAGAGQREEVWPLDYATAMSIAPFVSARLDPNETAETVFASSPNLRAGIRNNEGCRWLTAHQKDFGGDAAGSQATSASPNANVTLFCILDQCRKTGERLPPACPIAHLTFSVAAGNIANINTNSLPESACTWICVHTTRTNLKVRHGPCALMAIDSIPVVYPSEDD